MINAREGLKGGRMPPITVIIVGNYRLGFDGFMKSCYADWRSKIANFATNALPQLRVRFCSRMCVSKIANLLLPQQKHFSPFALFYVDFGPFFAGVFGVIVLLFIIRVQIFGDFPELLRAQLERPVLLCLIPEDLVL